MLGVQPGVFHGGEEHLQVTGEHVPSRSHVAVTGDKDRPEHALGQGKETHPLGDDEVDGFAQAQVLDSTPVEPDLLSVAVVLRDSAGDRPTRGFVQESVEGGGRQIRCGIYVFSALPVPIDEGAAQTLLNVPFWAAT